ncbi:MAG: arginine decarboxylase, pyruvoyl-dependent [Spirochaetaceae bacterium]|jgi:arginine decarboxylase|nr:arginine decarboxylase, pyruvoyl-dependent [Spirochaetaceae bacterium]
MNKYLLCSSVGNGQYSLTSFDDALRKSNLGNYNLVKVSSILPMKAKRVDHVDVPEGSILFTAFASMTSRQAGEVISAAIAVGIPADKTKAGVIMEFADSCAEFVAEKTVKAMVVEAMAKRKYTIEEILCISTEAACVADQYSTVFAALAIW